MSKLPINKPDQAVSKTAMTERLAAMRKSAGVEEKRTLEFMCSVRGKPFAVTFKREREGERYRIERIDAGTPRAGGLLGRLFGGLAPEAQSYTAGEFNFYSFACPHCGHMASNGVGNFFGCECGVLHCGGTITVIAGRMLATCHPDCGRCGPLEDTLKRFSGTQSAAEAGRKAITGPDSPKGITGPSRK